MAIKVLPDNEPNDDDGPTGPDLNVQHSADDREISQLEHELHPGGAQTTTEEEDDDPLDEDVTAVKTSEAERDAATEGEQGDVRERKRQERLNQRQRQRQRIETLERQLANALASTQNANQRLSRLENTNLGTQAAQLEAAQVEAAEAEQTLKNIIADATSKQDGQRVAEATSALMNVSRRREMLANAKIQMDQAARQPKAQPLDIQVMDHAKGFMAKNPWYKGPNSSDLDSRILSIIDHSLTSEGWDPRSPTYWTELEKRAAPRLPHLFKPSKDASNGNDGAYTPPNTERRPNNRSPVAGASFTNGGGERKSSQSYRLSPQRVQAMKEAGVWDDPAKRADMVKRYQQADKEIEQEARR